MDDPLKWIANFQVREIAGTYCALCGRSYTEEDYENPVYVGEILLNSRSVHSECWAGFQLLCAHMGLNLSVAIARKTEERRGRIPPLGKRR